MSRPDSSIGTFDAEVDGVPFLRSIYRRLHNAGENYLLTAEDGEGNAVNFSVPAKLVEGIKHIIYPYTGALEWHVQFKNEPGSHLVKSGSAGITFDYDYRRAVGEISFNLKDERKVTGTFNLQNPGPA
ncbi:MULTISPECIES: hypothetical protein [Pseudomonas]|uniref:Uncharacterized protein n=1 Tax=Pseudomonas hamedanensis TaxID=2745504 RepID=A0A9E6P2A6_9PSED|nr:MULTISPECIES: hypothetical protein [Pseudomonas]MBC3777124.1 hypothetical protein [Pseudomonas sp. SWRI99]QXI18674.1 hypothetical protein HU739_006660 [Pseudomonas hamedanensis]